jgi:Flp pilus assembly protein TadB
VARDRVPVIDRALADIEAGRPWKARDRLNGYLHQHPADQPAHELLGEVYLAMGDLPAAGRALMLTERSDAQAAVAIEAFEHRYGSTAARIRALRVRAPLESWPPLVQERLGALRERSRVEGAEWEIGPAATSPDHGPTRWFEAIPLLAIFALVMVVPWVAGLVYIVVLLVKLL